MIDLQYLRYEEPIDELVKQNESYVEEVLALILLLKMMQLEGRFSKRELDKTLLEIERKTKKLDKYNRSWIEKYAPSAALDGAILSLVSLGELREPTSMREWVAYRTKVALNRGNRQLVNRVVNELVDDLSSVSKNLKKRARHSVNEILAENFRRDLLNRKTTNEIATNAVDLLKREYGNKVNHVLTDNAGRKWKMAHYVQMVVSTKLMDASNNATINESMERGVLLGRITHAPKTVDACRYHQGRIIRLDDAVEAPYPSYQELKASGQAFHPNCRHRVVPIRSTADLSDEDFEVAQRQGERGDLALSTGKRNPKEEEF